MAAFVSIPPIQTNAIPSQNDVRLLTNVSMGASFSSVDIALLSNITYAFQAVWTGTPVGLLSLEASCDSATDLNIPPTNWCPISGASSPAGGLAGTLIFSYQGSTVPYNWVRFVYTRTSGTGNLVSLNFNGR